MFSAVFTACGPVLNYHRFLFHNIWTCVFLYDSSAQKKIIGQFFTTVLKSHTIIYKSQIFLNCDSRDETRGSPKSLEQNTKISKSQGKIYRVIKMVHKDVIHWAPLSLLLSLCPLLWHHFMSLTLCLLSTLVLLCPLCLSVSCSLYLTAGIFGVWGLWFQFAVTGPNHLPRVLSAAPCCCFWPVLPAVFLSLLSTCPNRSRQMATHHEHGVAGGFFRFSFPLLPTNAQVGLLGFLYSSTYTFASSYSLWSALRLLTLWFCAKWGYI